MVASEATAFSEVKMFRVEETPEIRNALVSELAQTTSPTTVMGLTILIFGLFSYATVADPHLLVATVLGTAASFAKVVIMHRQVRSNGGFVKTRVETDRWEISHASVTAVVAASVAALSVMMFRSIDLHLHMLAAALLLGYSAGVASRVSVRPKIAASAITIAAVPTIISAALVGDTPHLILAGMFSVFFAAGMQSVWHVYTTARRQIVLALEMASHARQDGLTALPNRFSMQETFRSYQKSLGTLVGVHCFDLDGFKAINDRLGHSGGDELLRTVAGRLRSLVTLPNVAARFGGDEFVILQVGITTPREVAEFAEKTAAELVLPYSIFGEEVSIGVSLGYTISSADEANLDDMVRLADLASYRAKRRGGGIDVELPGGAPSTRKIVV
ncbi:diguanylate cyclase domain-containing protein [Rhizobium sp. NPDC090275]|uniref:diguanylate cyclase domain-containing protein n=1 Tax=Rhizobium sp. NPDC090275 TaxID=3364498 RepID=UPI00383AE2BA